eukprot:CAMPEP_0113684114 /NCGR_PEP_ID=MMETSP0038_2-20120614/13777_1 /TAXON_ID=2898 /ORGANISM="Cryptomonas paramecium" /LENGTH=92 /DNA_ID=CAMNT_0000603735 /DNA_START=431 /DNA_END=710 /DNA_ORIENTATION=+ /assembly_acc=CAM_ASM_000170
MAYAHEPMLTCVGGWAYMSMCADAGSMMKVDGGWAYVCARAVEDGWKNGWAQGHALILKRVRGHNMRARVPMLCANVPSICMGMGDVVPQCD